MSRNTQVERVAQQIRDKLPRVDSVDRAAEVVADDIRGLMGSVPEHLQRALETATEVVRATFEDVEILRPSSIIKPREDWYAGPSPGDHHWPALENYLLEKGWDEDAVRSIDDTSSEVVSLLANPARDQFRCRGLVVGYVQSGKTANMTAVMSKAIDAGYNLIVLLAGMTNKLRAQTQGRLENDLVARHRDLWQLYTTQEDGGDFVVPRNGSFTMPVESRAQLAVMKKVTSRLEAFQRTIEKTPPMIRNELKVLLIDDECDEGSVNAASGEYDMTRINACIREIVGSLPGVSYVGYTATPFANVFIDPFPHNKEELDDLYPEDFVTTLPRPEGYFGAREVFGRDPDNADDQSGEDEGKNVIRAVSEDELDRLRPPGKSNKDEFHPEVTGSLEEAILWFIGSCAIRLARGHRDRHMTMLVHTSPFVIQHQYMARAIGDWIDGNKDELCQGKGPVFEELKELMQRELDAYPEESPEHRTRPSADEALDEMNEVLSRIQLAIENGTSEYRLDYSGEAKIYIVIGGAVLSRGLTLEGLMVSFFLRTSKQYDTLLQMGRWFGFRHGYEDLPRLWTTRELASSFRSLSHIEEEIRDDIATYRENNLTPMEFAVRVRTIPGMAITSAAKMKHAYRREISYEGRHIQTIRFDHRDRDAVKGNWRAGEELIESIGHAHFGKVSKGCLATGVPLEAVRRFLSSYRICDKHMDLNREHLLGFVDGNPKMLAQWNVALVQPNKGGTSNRPLDGFGQVHTVNRSKLKLNEENYADIKALMSKQDVLIDVDEDIDTSGNRSWKELKEFRPEVPLLLLYPIDAESKARKGSPNRADLDALDDLLGIGVVFPGSVQRGGNYFSVDLDVPTPEELDEIENVQAEDTGELNDD
jgi:hypothetical protein